MKKILTKLVPKAPKSIKSALSRGYKSINNPSLRKYAPVKQVYIEITSACNLRCVGCYRNLHDYPAKNKFMSLEDFKKYVDQLPTTLLLSTYGLGEPTIHPKVKEMLIYAKNSGKFFGIEFVTNALAKEGEFYDELFKLGLDKLTISVDSLDSKEANILRPPTDVEKLEKNVKYLAEKYPNKMDVNMVISKINLHTFPKTVKKLVELGVPTISCQPYDNVGDSTRCLSLEEKESVIKQLELLKAEKLPVSGRDWFRHATTYCKSTDVPVITVDGFVSPCGRMFDAKIINVGNAKEQTFKEIFFSKRYSSLQKIMKCGKYPSFCKGCMRNHSENDGVKSDESK